MRLRALVLSAVLALPAGARPALAQPAEPGRLNPVIALLERGEPVFGLYAPPARSGRGEDAVTRSAAEIARETLAFRGSDFVFDGSMERGLEPALGRFVEYVEALREGGATLRTHPLVVKAPRIADDPAAAAEAIHRQLAAGASGIMFVEVESADEVRAGLAAMRFRSRGGTRPDADLGSAPAVWGVSEEAYRERADPWPLEAGGELVNWTIVESLAGLENVREIAAVEGVGVLWPGAGTLRRVFTTTGPGGERAFDAEGWEAAIRKVLAACQEFDVPCGFPAGPDDIEMRMRQGFSVFVMGWGDGGFETIEVGRRLSRR